MQGEARRFPDLRRDDKQRARARQASKASKQADEDKNKARLTKVKAAEEMANDAIQARVLAQCLFNKDRYSNMFLRELDEDDEDDEFTFADINPDVVELLMFEAIAAMVHVQEGIRKRNGDLQGLDLAKRRVIWRGAIEACNEGLRDAITAVPDKYNGEKSDREPTPCSKLLKKDTKNASACSSLPRPTWHMRTDMAGQHCILLLSITTLRCAML